MSEDGGIRGVVRAVIRPRMLRTCSACGNKWTVSRLLAKRHIRGLPVTGLGGGRSSPLIESAAVIQRFDQTAAMNEELSEMSAAYSHCPKCQSAEFSQRRMWRESKAAFSGEDDPG